MEKISPFPFEKSSFRDHHGRVFFKNNHVYRFVNFSYQRQYDHLLRSGLYDELVKEQLLIKHTEVSDTEISTGTVYKVIKPEVVSFISYPSEWCFSQLKDAALTTLKVQLIALKYGMILKDSSAFNIQFHRGRPLLIDTLSFDLYENGSPWVAYKQFCEHFLAPLCLMAYCDPLAVQLFTLEGVSLPLAVKLLPLLRKFNPNVLIHLVLHAKAQNKYKEQKVRTSGTSLFNLKYVERLTKNLTRAVNNISYNTRTTWDHYYEKDVATSYFSEKFAAVETLIGKIRPESVWDIGGNNGIFSRISAQRNIFTISTDSDFSSIEESYFWIKKQSSASLLPLVLDITNPTSSSGWANEERKSFLSRIQADTILMLAIIHHLVISSGIPLNDIAAQIGSRCQNLIIEFVPKEDLMVKKLLQNREDIFDDYNRSTFELAFFKYFKPIEIIEFSSSLRTLYHLQSLEKE